MSERQNYKNSQQITSDPVQLPQNYNIKSLYNKKYRCLCSHEDLNENFKNCSKVKEADGSSNSSKSTKNVRFSPKLVVSNTNLSKMAPGYRNNNNKQCCCSTNKEKIIQLKKELKTIKKCLLEACTNKKEQIELEIKLQCLNEKNRAQKEEIERLKQTNRSPLGVVRDNSPTCKDAMAVKQDLDEYKNKLDDLYKEFVDSARIMEATKKTITKTVDEKSTEFQALQQKLEEKTVEYDELKRAYEDLIEINTRLSDENEKIAKYLIELKESARQLLQASADKIKEQEEFHKKSEKLVTQYNKLAKENQQLRKILQAFIEIVRDNEKAINTLKEFIQARNVQVPPDLLQESDKSKENYNLIQLIDELNQLMASMYEQIEESIKKDEIIQQQQQQIRKLQSTLNDSNKGGERFETFLSPVNQNTDTTDES